MAYLRCISAFVDFRNGAVESYNPGRLVNGNDPVVKGRESYFEPVEVAAARAAGVEQATAAPGEKRNVSPVAKKTASKD
jgi:hypothetical protein